MRLLGVAIIIALLIGATFLAVTLGDRDLFTPPPESMAEGFVREVLTARYPRALDYVEGSVGEGELEKLHDAIESKLGEVSQIEAETIVHSKDQALVVVRLSSASGSDVLHYALVFDEGWKVRVDR